MIALVATRQSFLRLVVRELLNPQADERPAIDGLGRLVDMLSERAPGVPVQGAVMQLISGSLLRGAAAPSGGPLWPDSASAQAMAFHLLLPKPPPRGVTADPEDPGSATPQASHPRRDRRP
jgi:hypothetical protein